MIFQDKTILVTGGTGSMGKTFIRRVLSGEAGTPRKIIVLSRDEAKQHDMRMSYLHKLVATDEVMNAFQEADPRVPAWLPTLEQVDDPFLSAFGEITPYAQPMPNIPEMGAVWGSWGDSIQLIMNGEDVTESLTNGANQIRELIAGGS